VVPPLPSRLPSSVPLKNASYQVRFDAEQEGGFDPFDDRVVSLLLDGRASMYCYLTSECRQHAVR